MIEERRKLEREFIDLAVEKTKATNRFFLSILWFPIVIGSLIGLLFIDNEYNYFIVFGMIYFFALIWTIYKIRKERKDLNKSITLHILYLPFDMPDIDDEKKHAFWDNRNEIEYVDWLDKKGSLKKEVLVKIPNTSDWLDYLLISFSEDGDVIHRLILKESK